MDLDRNVLTSLAANVGRPETSAPIRDGTSTIVIVYNSVIIIAPPVWPINRSVPCRPPAPQREGKTLTSCGSRMNLPHLRAPRQALLTPS
jgi:hypothetical protein